MSDIIDWYQRVLVDTGRAAALWLLLGFLVTFIVTRGITRRIRGKKAAEAAQADAAPTEAGGLKNVYIGGVHIHHQVWGILLVLITGLLEFRFNPESPWGEVLGALFGAGAALTLDEFALWFHLDDVYWSREGQKSIDAILIGAALGSVLLIQGSAIGSERGSETLGVYIAVLALHLCTAAISFLKGKLATGMIGIVVPFVATVGAIRLAKPNSVWARRRYSGHKLERAKHRFGERYSARQEKLRDLVGGNPDPDK
ncbi:hypothetical protein Rhe02_77540 [Rhizocola hellebori]|uniref:Integral membrane protein n=1 Tax=Rhizocola hellebori TaxID=1392758 RepID=A0A8J3VKM3_9ACTN|nr:hypothetical protein [Rhizocola hellebori]GIH09687.1 hypothetical protein Rhe02_77540 [Rhizocola hellebori]